MITYKKMVSTTAIELHPEATPVGSVIWLHGLGADGHDFVPIVSELNLPENLPLRFIFPHAPLRPVTINNGYVMRAWFDIFSWDRNERLDQEGIARSEKLVGDYIEKELQSGIPSNKIVLAGFSQGSFISLTTSLNYPKPLAGVLALSGFLPNAEQFIANSSKINQKMPIFFAHGTQDMILSYELGEKTAQIFKSHGYPITWHSYVMAHSVCPQEITDIATWLTHTFNP